MGGNVQSWQLVQVTTPAPTAPAVANPSGQPAFLGFGLTTPFVRGANDFASAAGVELVKSCVSQVLGTIGDTPISGGELPWRTEFGSALERMRHRNQDYMFVELARTYVVDAITRWEPRALVKTVRLGQSTSNARQASIFVTFDVIRANVPGNAVVAADQTVEIPIPGGA